MNLGLRSSFEQLPMSRLATYLAAAMLAFSQPLAMACECQGCAGTCSDEPAANTSHTSCCATIEAGSRSCCSTPAGQCPCSTAHTPDGSASGTSESAPCLCSTEVPATAVTADAVSVTPSHDAGYFLPPSAAVAVDGRFGEAATTLAPHGPPVRFAGLRAHAFLGVWLI
jgi:hypothetical protein